MGTWIEKPLGEILKLTKGISYKTSDYGTEDDGIIFINLKCIAKSGGFSQRGIKYYKGFVPENLKLKSGDVIIANTDLTRNGDIVGCPLILPDFPNNDVTMSMDLSRLDLISDEVDGKFVYYALMTSSARSFMKENSSGSTVLHLKTSKVPLYRILIPFNKFEQITIATILTTIDQSIEKTEQLIAKYERIKTGLMQDLLTRGIDELGNIRSEETHEFKNSPLGRIPVEWEHYNLQECCDTVITYGIVQAGEHLEDGVPYIRTGDMSGDFLKKKGLLFTSKKIAKKFERSKVEVGDIVFALRATVGKVLPVPAELSGANLTQGTAKISPKEGINDKFILWMLRSDNILRQIRLVIKGTTFAEISLSNLRKIIIYIPANKAEQDKIAMILDDINNFITTQKLNLNKLTHQKVALMQDLLSGKVSVDDLIGSYS